MKFTLGMILEARERLKGVAQRTGLVQFKALSDEHSQIYLKTEDLQNTGSFKVRGAYIKIASLSEEERACGVIASSAGNHAQGVALAAKAFGVPATIVMPGGRAAFQGEGHAGAGRERRAPRQRLRRRICRGMSHSAGDRRDVYSPV